MPGFFEVGYDAATKAAESCLLPQMRVRLERSEDGAVLFDEGVDAFSKGLTLKRFCDPRFLTGLG